MSKTKLSDTGETIFIVQNADHDYIMEALKIYNKVLNTTTFSPNAPISKAYAIDRLKSLNETFKLEK